MGLHSMPSAADAFFPVVLLANALLPLLFLRDGIRWLLLHLMLGHAHAHADPHEREMADARPARGVRLSKFKSLRLDRGRKGRWCCCCVCLRGFEGEEEVSQVVACRHFFHRRCLDGWLHRMHTTCPLCRSSL